MLQLFWNILRDRGSSRDITQDPAWRRDPLAHPVLDRMTPTELADLPLRRVRYDSSKGR